MKLPLYDLEPRTENCWIAPNATLGISFFLTSLSSWRSLSKEMVNCLVQLCDQGRHKQSRVFKIVFLTSLFRIMNFTSIGDGTVIHTAASLPTGMSA